MLKIRIIPTLLWKTVGLVKGRKFDSSRRVGPVLPAIKVYNRREVDELILLDIAANETGDAPDTESIADFSADCFVPLTVGGGITHLSHVQPLLRAGADKVSLNTVLHFRPELVTDIAKAHGKQCVVASIDVRSDPDLGWRCFVNAGRIDTGREMRSFVREMEDRGAGEILITSIDHDGMMEGYDLPLIEAVVNEVDIPVIASGGAGTYQHMVDAVVQCGASAVAAASMFHFTEQTPSEARAALEAAGVSVRKPYVETA